MRLKILILYILKAKEKHNCECGGKYTSSSKALHFKSKKHQLMDKKLENYVI